MKKSKKKKLYIRTLPVFVVISILAISGVATVLINQYTAGKELSLERAVLGDEATRNVDGSKEDTRTFFQRVVEAFNF
jgi:hypothetical protein